MEVVSIPKAEELFYRFQPRFREITWHPREFVTEEPPKFVDGGIIMQGESLLLAPGFLGQTSPIPDRARALKGGVYCTYSWMSDGSHGSSDQRTRFQMREGNIGFLFRFDPGIGFSMQNQLKHAAIQALNEGPLKDRRFFMDPVDTETSGLESFSMRFSLEGDSIPGLTLGEARGCWEVFIPEGPERTAIETALQLESQQQELDRAFTNDPRRKHIEDLKSALVDTLSVVST